MFPLVVRIAFECTMADFAIRHPARKLFGWVVHGIRARSVCLAPPIPVEWRLGLTTGFLGGLTTFSTFSAEAIGLLQAGHYPALLLHVGSHVLASLTLTWCGLKLGQWLWA